MKVPDQAADSDAPVEAQRDASSRDRDFARTRNDRLVEQLRRHLEGDEVDPKLLDQLGWDVEKAWQFVRDYERTKQGVQRQTSGSTPPTRVDATMTRPAPGDVRRGQTVGDGGRALGAQHRREADRTNELALPSRQRVPRHLDGILRGYYSSVASRPASRPAR